MNEETRLSTADKYAATETISKMEERFDRLRRRAGFYVAPLAFGITFLLTRGRLTPEGTRMGAVLACVLVLWLTESIPLPVTAILGACLCIGLGIADVKTVLAPFADPIIFLFIGGFIIARAMMIHRLDCRFALAILSLRVMNGSQARLLAAFGGITALLSMWVTNSAATAMMMPIALGILRATQHMRLSDCNQF